MKGFWKSWVPEPDPGKLMERKIEIASKKVEKVFLWYVPRVLIIILFISSFSGYSQEEPLRYGLGDPEVREFVRLANTRRRSVGCPELKWDDRIAAVAQKHSRDMVGRKFFSHQNPDGEDPFDRLEGAGLFFKAAAENIASGPKTGKEVYESWLINSSHRENLLDCRFLRHGVGRADGRWTHVLFRP